MKFHTTAIVLLASHSQSVKGFAPSVLPPQVAIRTATSGTRSTGILYSSNEDQKEKGVMDIISMKVDIPEEVREEIFRAEANTPAAKDRNKRVAVYGLIAFIGIALSSLNVFLTGIREDAGAAVSDLSSIEDLGFGWVGSNPLTSFFLLNKLGGGFALISAGFGGTMVELETRTKNENAEKIWKELQRRKSEAPKKKRKKAPTNKKKKQKNKKRLSALSEVILEDERSATPVVENAPDEQKEDVSTEESKEEGFMGKMKDFYDKADKMAASQALLLNKELEDKGIVDKITDETGLKVIGKEAAAKLKDQEQNSKNE